MTPPITPQTVVPPVKQYGIQITYWNLTDNTSCTTPVFTPIDPDTNSNIAAFMSTTPNPNLAITVKGIEVKLEIEI